MNIVLTSATSLELREVNNNLPSLYTLGSDHFHVSFHRSGVGTLLTTYSLSRLIAERQPALIIQAGIAGTFDREIPLGEVVVVKDEFLGDVGVEENGTFKDVFDLNLENGNEFPFEGKSLSNHWLEQFNLLKLPVVSAATVNEVSTRPGRIEILKSDYGAQIESMEGAPLHYIGLQTLTPFIQIRAISNYVGERDKSKWQMKEALDNLTAAVLGYIDQLYAKFGVIADV